MGLYHNASVEQLKELPGIGEVKAQKLFDHIKKNEGGITTLEEYRAIAGVNETDYAAGALRLDLSPKGFDYETIRRKEIIPAIFWTIIILYLISISLGTIFEIANKLQRNRESLDVLQYLILVSTAVLDLAFFFVAVNQLRVALASTYEHEQKYARSSLHAGITSLIAMLVLGASSALRYLMQQDSNIGNSLQHVNPLPIVVFGLLVGHAAIDVV